MINDRYKIKKKLGFGRSQVYLCSDLLNPAKNIVIKILSSTASTKELENFKNEFFLLRKISHPNIVKAYEYGTVLKNENTLTAEIIKGSKFFTMDYVEGQTLDKYDDRSDPQILKEIIAQICEVLYYLHQSNYIFYNLKPDNIIIQNKNNGLFIYFYDFRLAKYIPNKEPFEVQGTPHYIAPEILLINQVDHKADLYSLGIMLYYLIYDRFPFDTESELNIYKANIEKTFEFPNKNSFEKLIIVTESLLNKSPGERCSCSLRVLEKLDVPITERMKNNWKPIISFCGRKEELFDINSIIYDDKTREVIAIRGEDGSGKSLLLEEIHYKHANSILIKASNIVCNNKLWKVLLRNIFFSETIYQNINEATKSEIQDLLAGTEYELTDKLKSLFLRISRTNKFVLLLDDFNNFDDLSIEILKEIIPILQVNGIKIVLTENTQKIIASKFIHNLSVFNLHPFSEADLNEYLEKSYFKQFPKQQLKNFIIHNSDLFPGNISRLINNLVFLDSISYSYCEVIVAENVIHSGLIENTPEELFKLKLGRLSNDELKLVNLCALFNIRLDIKTISTLTGFNEEIAENIVSGLIGEEIFYTDDVCLNPQFSSGKLKNYAYNSILSKKEDHQQTAEKILELIPEFDFVECARQFELAGEYDKCNEVLKKELNSDAARSNLNYQKKILSRLASSPLDSRNLSKTKYLLCNVLFQLEEFDECIFLINKLLEEEPGEEQKTELLYQKGKCLISLKEYGEGIELLNSQLENVQDDADKQNAYLELARANLYLNNYSDVSDICRNIISDKKSTDESKAKAYYMIALVEQENNNNIAGAIYNFQYAINMYERANLPRRVVLMEMNIGNIIYNKGNLNEAERHWQTAFKINEKIGNLSNEANILLNYGKYYFNTQMFDKAVEYYKRAENIYSCLGNTSGHGLVVLNLGEVYSNICEYDLALKNLELAKNIFDKIDAERTAAALFLFGQCCFYLGDSEKLEAVIISYEKIIPQKDSTERHKNNLAYLKILLLFIQEKYLSVIQDAGTVVNYFKNETSQESLSCLAKSSTLLIKSLINLRKYKDADKQLTDKNYLIMCGNNSVLNAERQYLLGIISEKYEDSKHSTEAEYFNKALRLIENQSILELTWEINYALAIFYFERGNYKRFSDYSLVTKSLVNFISSKINSKTLRATYLNGFKRKLVIEILENYEKLI